MLTRCTDHVSESPSNGGASNIWLIVMAGDIESNPGPCWVQYSFYHKGEADRVGEALLKLDDQWQTVPREALANWLKLVLMSEMANSMGRVDAVLVTLEMPLGSQVTNDQVYEYLSSGIVNVAVVAPRPPGTMHNHHQFMPMSSAAQPQDVLLDNGFNRLWNTSIGVLSSGQFSASLPHQQNMDGSLYTSAAHTLPIRTNASMKNMIGFGSCEKRKRQEKWTEHETLVLIASRHEEEEELSRVGDGSRMKFSGDRWSRTAELMRGKGVMDREGKNCEDRMTNLKKDWVKIRDWNAGQGALMRYWDLSVTDRKMHKLPVNMSEAVYKALEETEFSRFKARASSPSSVTEVASHPPEGALSE